MENKIHKRPRAVYQAGVLVIIALSFVSVVAYYKFAYTGKLEREFMRAVQEKLMHSADKEIPLAGVADFDWDAACYYESDNLGGFGGSTFVYITNDPHERRVIARSFRSISFFKEKKLVRVLGYQGFEKIKIDNEYYRFLGRFEENACQSRTEAMLQAKISTDGCCEYSYNIILKPRSKK